MHIASSTESHVFSAPTGRPGFTVSSRANGPISLSLNPGTGGCATPPTEVSEATKSATHDGRTHHARKREYPPAVMENKDTSPKTLAPVHRIASNADDDLVEPNHYPSCSPTAAHGGANIPLRSTGNRLCQLLSCFAPDPLQATRTRVLMVERVTRCRRGMRRNEQPAQ